MENSMRPALLVLLVAALFPPAARAKPLTIHLDTEVANSLYTFEGTVEGHDEATLTSRVRVTYEADRIYRGFALAGSDVTLVWPRGGPEGYRNAVGPGARLLWIVRSDGEIVATGAREGAGYRVRGYYDFNAVLVVIEGRERDFEEMQAPLIEADWFWEKTGKDARTRAVAIAKILLASEPEEGAAARFAEAVAALESDSWEERERAESLLSGPLGASYATELEKLADSSPAPEVKMRARRALGRLADVVAARELAADFGEPGAPRWRILALALGAEDHRLAAASHEALHRETGRDLAADVPAWLAAIGKE
ncbi:MAG: hypothetical protein HY720_12350 [Planctomycetes bacterium]|nr:hypothetical protein [Planctomycetota bacterium]